MNSTGIQTHFLSTFRRSMGNISRRYVSTFQFEGTQNLRSNPMEGIPIKSNVKVGQKQGTWGAEENR